MSSVNIVLIVLAAIVIVLGLIGRSRLKKDPNRWHQNQFPANMGKAPPLYWVMLLVGVGMLLIGFTPIW